MMHHADALARALGPVAGADFAGPSKLDGEELNGQSVRVGPYRCVCLPAGQ
jgi:hypothetical protein